MIEIFGRNSVTALSKCPGSTNGSVDTVALLYHRIVPFSSAVDSLEPTFLLQDWER